MMLSNCCSSPPWHELETGICSKCHMHAGFTDEGKQDSPLAKRTRDSVFSSQQQAIIDSLMADTPEE